MKYYYHPRTPLEKFGQKIYFLLVENFSESYWVGGAVRDTLLSRNVIDIDLATSASPAQITFLLSQAGIKCDQSNAKFGVIKAQKGRLGVEITTFRKDSYGKSRYPKVSFIKSYKLDSKRRDFTINSLYLKEKEHVILDPNGGLKDIEQKLIRFVGNPNRRIEEDPLRIVRAIRFALLLNFKLESRTLKAINGNYEKIKNISGNKLNSEILKLQNKNSRAKLKKILRVKEYLTLVA